MNAYQKPAFAFSNSFQMTHPIFGPGSSHGSQGLTFVSFFSSLAIPLAIFIVQTSLFLILKKRLPRVYEPKAQADPSRKSTKSVLGWVVPLFSVTLSEIKNKSNLDEYFFLRFLYLLFFIFTCSSCFVFPILGAVNWVSTDKSEASNLTTLDTISWANISSKYEIRYLIHAFLAIIFVSFICWMMYFELSEYVKIRHKILSSKEHRQKVSSRTILIRSVPKEYQHKDKILELFSIFPNSVKAIWINRDHSQLVSLINKRREIFKKLEKLENYIVWKCNKNNRAKNKKKKGYVAYMDSSPDIVKSPREPENQIRHVEYHTLLPGKKWLKYMKKSDVPKIRLPAFQFRGRHISLPFMGVTIDALTWYKIELNRLNAEIKAMQENTEKFYPINSCFVEFHHQLYAHITCQSILFENPQLSGQCFLEIDPNDINWSNIKITWFQAFIGKVVATILNILVILGWTFPVALTAILSQLDYLPELFEGFVWIDYLPARFRIMISAILPSLAVSTLMGFAPIIFQYLARLKGYTSKVAIDLDVQKYLFLFIFIQVFIVISLSRGVTVVIAQVLFSPLSVLSLLAANIPKGANFFYSFIFLQGLTISSSTLLQTGRLIRVYIINPISNRTPHETYSSHFNTVSLQWGSLYPSITCLAIISVVYSIIAPLITIFASLTFGLLYVAYKYRILYCNGKFEMCFC